MRVQCVILGGAARLPPIFGALAAIPLPLRSITDSLDVLGCWEHSLAGLQSSGVVRVDSDGVCLVAGSSKSDDDCWEERVAAGAGLGRRWVFHLDRSANRGAAGVLADWNRATFGLSVAEWVLVVDASASPAIEVARLFDMVDDSVAGVVGASDLGRYCGCLLIRREWLRVIPTVGFIDLREQFLGSVIKRGGRICCATVARRALRLNTRESWLKSVASWERSGTTLGRDPQVRTNYWRHGACVVEKGAVVDGSRIVSSIVLSGAIVEPGACVARSVVCPGAVVRSGEVIVDCVLTN